MTFLILMIFAVVFFSFIMKVQLDVFKVRQEREDKERKRKEERFKLRNPLKYKKRKREEKINKLLGDDG
jgi:hypothetical protein